MQSYPSTYICFQVSTKPQYLADFNLFVILIFKLLDHLSLPNVGNVAAFIR